MITVHNNLTKETYTFKYRQRGNIELHDMDWTYGVYKFKCKDEKHYLCLPEDNVPLNLSLSDICKILKKTKPFHFHQYWMEVKDGQLFLNNKAAANVDYVEDVLVAMSVIMNPNDNLEVIKGVRVVDIPGGTTIINGNFCNVSVDLVNCYLYSMLCHEFLEDLNSNDPYKVKTYKFNGIEFTLDGNKMTVHLIQPYTVQVENLAEILEQLKEINKKIYENISRNFYYLETEFDVSSVTSNIYVNGKCLPYTENELKVLGDIQPIVTNSFEYTFDEQTFSIAYDSYNKKIKLFENGFNMVYDADGDYCFVIALMKVISLITSTKTYKYKVEEFLKAFSAMSNAVKVQNLKAFEEELERQNYNLYLNHMKSILYSFH